MTWADVCVVAGRYGMLEHYRTRTILPAVCEPVP